MLAESTLFEGGKNSQYSSKLNSSSNFYLLPLVMIKMVPKDQGLVAGHFDDREVW